MSKHTPGPWTLIKTELEHIVPSWHVEIGDQEIYLFPYKRIYSEDRSQSGLVTDEQRMADARLIASAPDLLEALKSCAERLQIHMQHSEDLIAHMQAVKAIAKATGND